MENIARSLSVALGERDVGTREHCDRVVKLSLEIGRKIELTHREMGLLAMGAQFHDIGKIGIPDRLLTKPSAFDDNEFECMKQHSEIGERIILALDGEVSRELASIVRHHHERYDGSGYPDCLRGTDIPLLSRIISLADNYDAMAGARPYSRPRPHHEIMDIMSSEVRLKHDPDLMHVFCAVVDQPELQLRDH